MLAKKVRNRRLHAKLKALLGTLQETEGNKHKGPLLVEAFSKEPHIAMFFMLVGINPGMLATLGVSHKLLTKALIRAGFDIEEGSDPSPTITLEFYEMATYAHATILYEGRKVGTGSFLLNEDFSAVTKRLRQAGVMIDTNRIKEKLDGKGVRNRKRRKRSTN